MFDHAKLDLFKHANVERGYLEANDRQKVMMKLPLVTLSLALIDSSCMMAAPHIQPSFPNAPHR